MTKLIEPAAAGILNILQNGMDAIVDKINAEYAQLDGSGVFGEAALEVPLPHIKAYALGDREIEQLPERPCVLVDPMGSAIDPERFDNTWAVYDHSVTVTVITESDDPDVCARQIMRYARAVWEVCYGNQNVQDQGVTHAISIRPVRGQATTPITRNATISTLLRGWVWVLEVHREDNLT